MIKTRLEIVQKKETKSLLTSTVSMASFEGIACKTLQYEKLYKISFLITEDRLKHNGQLCSSGECYKSPKKYEIASHKVHIRLKIMWKIPQDH